MLSWQQWDYHRVGSGMCHNEEVSEWTLNTVRLLPEKVWSLSAAGPGVGMGEEPCIRDPQLVHLAAERHCLFSQCLSLVCSARLLTTTIVFGAAVPREALSSSCSANRASCLDKGRGRPFIYNSSA